jgi:hypothetical protein
MPISRAQLPEEFFDRTSATLLAQPEPQYLYARLFMRAMNIQLGLPTTLGRAGYEIGGQGAPYTAAEADRLMLSDDMATEVYAAKADFTGEPGHIMKFNRPKYANTTYTQAVREVGTNQSVSTTPISASSEQALLQIKRFAGPYDQDNGRVAPYGLDAFDASMGVHDLTKFVGTHLKRDFHRTLDAFWVTLADLASTTAYPYGMSAANDATTKGQFPLTYEFMSRVSKSMDESNLPTLGDGRRILVVTPTGKKQLKDDPQFARYAEFYKEANPLFPGWFGSTAEFHCFMSNTLTITSNSSSINIHNGHAIAPGAFLGGRGKTIDVRAASDDNYGETAKVIWLAYLALGLADNRFIVKLSYTEDVS